MNNLNFTAIDFETATFDRSSICEIGIAVVRDSSIVEKKSWLVKPKYNYYDSFNIDIHGITPEMTKNSPNFKTVWKEVLPYLDESVVVSHNTAFDMYALKDALDEAKLAYPNFDYFCSMRVARYIIDSYSYSLDALCDKLAIQLDNHHRAGDDAAACANILLPPANCPAQTHWQRYKRNTSSNMDVSLRMIILTSLSCQPKSLAQLT